MVYVIVKPAIIFSRISKQLLFLVVAREATERVLKKYHRAIVTDIFSICFISIQSKLFYEQRDLRWKNKCALRIKYWHKKSRMVKSCFNLYVKNKFQTIISFSISINAASIPENL